MPDSEEQEADHEEGVLPGRLRNERCPVSGRKTVGGVSRREKCVV